ncbi:MAG: alpha/beta hydrolase, partial [Parvularculaceae bacterium]
SFRNDFHDVLERVRNAPVEVALPHTLTKEPMTVRVRYEELAVGVRYALYSTAISAGLPLAVEQAKAGDYRALTQLLPQILYFLSDIASEGMWASVRCAEEFPFLDQERARALSEGTMLGATRLDSGNAICEFWPRGKAAPDFHDPVVADTPVLILAGGVDAATPPWMGEETARHLPNARLILIPNRSHWGLGGDACIDGLVDAFIEQASADALDDGCVAGYARPPFALPQ